MSEEPTVEQILADPVGWCHTEAEVDRIQGDILVGTSAMWLLNCGQTSSAAL